MPKSNHRIGTRSAHIPSSFRRKKATILAELERPDNDYTDKSPKGSVDAEILELIAKINEFEGYVTTSSCAGRVVVFVEGRKALREDKSGVVDGASDAQQETGRDVSSNATSVGGGPGGKGHGNKWFPVPVEEVSSTSPTALHDLFQLEPKSTPSSGPTTSNLSYRPDLRLIKLSFSPLILHILCANLQGAKVLLAAAINAGFRESGVQSLKALDDEEAGVMLAIRTAGLGFDTVVGCVEEQEDYDVLLQVDKSCVDEHYLRMCTGVINERFVWNNERKERLIRELVKLKTESEANTQWEDADTRRERKRQEGLQRRAEKQDQNMRAQTSPETEKKQESMLEEGLLPQYGI
ncbi:hypothetical protein LTR64_007198 [Lithohypha guttulata]|uniref:uncharacterized protein n=1 Tax=Lithohypha guttulata TaxID=1690604 RepID=UPI002DE13E1A|nr:hypothetical protein LTR51_004246 [Lithohypha guttulata]